MRELVQALEKLQGIVDDLTTERDSLLTQLDEDKTAYVC